MSEDERRTKPIQEDLLAAHSDALRQGGDEAAQAYRQQFTALFANELSSLEPLLQLAEQLNNLLHPHSAEELPQAMRMNPAVRADLKADLIAQAHQQRLRTTRESREWGRWAALGATVAGVLAAAAWRNNYRFPS